MNAKYPGPAGNILFTDFYQLTMAQLYFRTGLYEKEARFDYFFRSCPDYGSHQAGYCINAGLAWLLDWMGEAKFGEEEIACLEQQKRGDGAPLFAKDFLGWLRDNGDFRGLSLRAVPEGRVVHPNVPLVVAQGPLVPAQILESTLLNHLNYQTLVATKASRLRQAGCDNLLIDFGMRRAQGSGANAGARAALIGGADFTSNTGISCALGYPPKGTHAHSMVQAFMALGGSELDAFRAYADLYPDDCLLLVDTIDTLRSGVPHAVTVFEELRRKGHRPLGIRLDSGDLAYLSIRAARLLNEAGFEDAGIVLSNQLDELVIWQIVTRIRKEAFQYGVDPDHLVGRLVYGVGTRLITSEGCAALDGVYKLTAVREGGEWKPAFKLSENAEKTINPGEKRSWRVYGRRGKAVGDLLSLADEDPRSAKELVLRHPIDETKYRTLQGEEISEIEPLEITVMEDGKIVYEQPEIEDMRRLRDADLEALDPGVTRLVNPHVYHVSLTGKLWEIKRALIRTYGGGLK
ncbi:MAG: nicotinate phosphoribosyltransferase [PVC group bacterium]